MAHYFDVISCGIKQMHRQFKSLFTGIDSRDTAVLAVSSTHLIYSFMSFLSVYLFFCHC